MNNINIGNRSVGNNVPVYIVAELSSNHMNNFDIVEKTIKAAADANADAIKLATLTPDSMTIDSQNEDFIIRGGTQWDGRSFYDLYSETSMPYEWHYPIIKIAKSYGLECFSTPYDISAADFLHKLGMPAYKVASFEITDTQLIKHIASFNKPVIISTGIATRDEIDDAIKACVNVGNYQVILLKCTSGYPAPLKDLNLRTIHSFKNDFRILTGLSDHTMSNEVPVAATSLGACFIEKHIILDRGLGGPDAKFSLEPSEFKSMVNAVRNTELALGRDTYDLSESSKASRQFARSLYIVENIKQGQVLTPNNVKSIRPGFGLMPKHLNEILGRQVVKDVERGTALTWDLINI